MASKRTSRKKPSEAERAEKRASERQLMADAVAHMRSSDGWRAWLRARRHFHGYSLHNQMLIALQMPEATRVTGFKAWLKLGYAVRRGERGICIWAPCRPSKRRIREWIEAGSDPNNRPRTFFRMVKVFDRSQVAPLPEFPGGPIALDFPSEPVGGGGLAHLFPALCDLAAEIGAPVQVEAGRSDGAYRLRTRDIRVRPLSADFSANAQFAVGVHELSHALLRHERREDDPVLRRGEEEVVVECVAYTVCSVAGLDTARASVPYMTSWSAGGEIERYAELIDRLARRIEDGLGLDTGAAAMGPAIELAVA